MVRGNFRRSSHPRQLPCRHDDSNTRRHDDTTTRCQQVWPDRIEDAISTVVKDVVNSGVVVLAYPRSFSLLLMCPHFPVAARHTLASAPPCVLPDSVEPEHRHVHTDAVSSWGRFGLAVFVRPVHKGGSCAYIHDGNLLCGHRAILAIGVHGMAWHAAE